MQSSNIPPRPLQVGQDDLTECLQLPIYRDNPGRHLGQWLRDYAELTESYSAVFLSIRVHCSWAVNSNK